MNALDPNIIVAAPCFAAVCVQLHTWPKYQNARQLKWRPQIPVSPNAYHGAASLGWVQLRRPYARCSRCCRPWRVGAGPVTVCGMQCPSLGPSCWRGAWASLSWCSRRGCGHGQTSPCCLLIWVQSCQGGLEVDR